jgi:hypothetical protein
MPKPFRGSNLPFLSFFPVGVGLRTWPCIGNGHKSTEPIGHKPGALRYFKIAFRQMKLTISRLATFFLLLFAFENAANGQSKFDAWPELKSFHAVMSQTFHPMEDGDFAPIRARSGEMYDRAKALHKSKLPAEFDRPEIRAAVAELKKGSKALHKQIKKKASDEEVKVALSALHDVFHKIVGLCRDEKH